MSLIIGLFRKEVSQQKPEYDLQTAKQVMFDFLALLQ